MLQKFQKVSYPSNADFGDRCGKITLQKKEEMLRAISEHILGSRQSSLKEGADRFKEDKPEVDLKVEYGCIVTTDDG